MWGGGICVGIIPALLGGSAICQAASFDCSTARRPQERVICANPALSDLDGKLGKLYQERRRTLGSSGQALLRTSQKSWLHFIALTCAVDGSGLPQDTAEVSAQERDAADCLTRAYNSRVGQLERVGRSEGPFVFNSVDLFAATLSPDAAGEGASARYSVSHVSYPQIDSPSTKAAAEFNSRVARQIVTAGDCGIGDYDLDYDLGLVTAGMVSLRWTDSTYCHGTPHGFGGSRAEIYVLGEFVRLASAADIFGPAQGWQAKLQDLLWKNLQDSGWRSPRDGEEAQIRSELLRENRWFISKDGLQVSFNSYDGGCYACTPPPVTAGWSEILPLLPSHSILRRH